MFTEDVEHVICVCCGASCRAQMKKVMVTVLRHNAAAHEFFLNKLKYVNSSVIDRHSSLDVMKSTGSGVDLPSASYLRLSWCYI